MNYPQGLTAEQKNRIERARDVAEIELRGQLKAQERPHRLNLARDFVFQVFKVAAQQIAGAERNGIYSGAEGRQTLEWFVQWEIVPHVYELSDLAHFYVGFNTLSIEQFRKKLMEQLQNSDLWTEYLRERLASWAQVPGRQVTATLVSRRKNIVSDHRRTLGMTVPDYARHIGMSDSAIRGVIREDKSRYNEDSQKKLLERLQVTLDEWYRL